MAMKRALKIIGIVVALLLVVLVVLPFVINVNSFRPKLEATASDAVGRQVKVGNLSLSILGGSVTADNISIAEDPAFGSTPFVTAKSLKVGVELMPLILSKELRVTGITLEQPQITLLKTAGGKWNFSSLGGNAAKAPASSSQKAPAGSSAPAASSSAGPSSAPKVSVAKLSVTDGKLIVGDAKSKAKPHVYDDVNITVTNFSLASQFPFSLKAKLPAGGTADISGEAGPINSADASKTPFDAKVKVDNMDIVASGFIDPASGIAGLANFDGTLSSNGDMAKAVGTFTGNKLQFSPKGSPAPKAVVIKHTVNVDLDNQMATITQGDIEIGKAVAHLTGTFKSEGEAQIVNMKLDAPNMPVEELQAMLPALGVVLPSGSQLKGGTLSADLAIAGPIDKLVITGPVRLANTKLANFDLGAKLGALSAFAGKAVSNPDTSIENFSTTARVAPEGTRADNVNLTVPAIGVITGAGTVSPAGALNFKMLANLHGGVVGSLAQVAGGGKGIPFSIAGTTSKPEFVPDIKGLATGLAGGALQGVLGGGKLGAGKSNDAAGAAMEALGGLLGNKKKKQ
jgi:AsmA protein